MLFQSVPIVQDSTLQDGMNTSCGCCVVNGGLMLRVT